MGRPYHYLIFLAALLLTHFAIPKPARATETIFTLDPAQSVITLSGSALSSPLTQQGAGSLTGHFGGTIRADVTLSSIQFIGGSDLDAQTNGVWKPLPGGDDGSAPADFAGQVSTLLGTAVAAVRNIHLDLTSLPLSLNSGSFDASTLVFSFPTNANSTLDYRLVTFLGAQKGSQVLDAISTNGLTAQATLATTDAVQTLTIPVNATFAFKLITANDTLLTISGQLVGHSGGAPSLSFGSITVTNQVVTLEWPTEPGQTYQLQSSTNLNAWDPAATNLVATTNTIVFKTNVTGSLEFFRLLK